MAMSPRLHIFALFYLLVLQNFQVNVYGGDFIPNRLCGTLYSQINFQGDEFKLTDFDDTEDIRDDFRTSVSGWLNTASYTVESGCSMYVCTEKYFKGRCTLLNENFTQPDGRISVVQSANCTCQRNCNCQDVIIPNTIVKARAYLKGTGDCSSCNAEYAGLWDIIGTTYQFPFNISSAIKIRSGCTLTLFQTPSWGGSTRLLTQGMNKGIYDDYKSYRFSCNDDAYVPPPNPMTIVDTPMVHLPETSQALLHLFSANDSLVTHPGIQAAFKSLQNGRSYKRAYILLIGEYNPNFLFGDNKVCEYITGRSIRECHISLPVEEFGILYTELRIIYYYSYYGLPSNPEEDHVLAASLYDYFSNHEELSHVIPNAVVVYHYQYSVDPLTQPLWESSLFQRKLKILSALRPAIVDENYSNIIFYVETSNGMELRSLSTWKDNLRRAINTRWTFPKPTVIVIHSDTLLSGHYKGVNGYWKTVDGKHFPLSLIQKFRAICDMSGDSLGKAIFNRMFVETGTPPLTNVSESDLLPKDHWLVKQFELCFKNETIQSCVNATQEPKFKTEFTNTFLSKTKVTSLQTARPVQFPTCTCDQVLTKLAELNSTRDADSERINGNLLELENKLAEETSGRDQQQVNISISLQQHTEEIQALKNLLKISEVEQNRSVEQIAACNLRIQQLDKELAAEKLSRVQQQANTTSLLKESTEEIKALQNLLKISEEKQNRSVEQISGSELDIQQLKDELATQKNSRDADLAKIKTEILDHIKSQLNILYGNV